MLECVLITTICSIFVSVWEHFTHFLCLSFSFWVHRVVVFILNWETRDCRFCCLHAAYISFESDLVLSRLCVRVPSELNKSLSLWKIQNLCKKWATKCFANASTSTRISRNLPILCSVWTVRASKFIESLSQVRKKFSTFFVPSSSSPFPQRRAHTAHVCRTRHKVSHNK